MGYKKMDRSKFKDQFADKIFPLDEKTVRCVVSKFSYGMGDQDPLEKVLFFSSKNKKAVDDWSDETAQPLEIKIFIFWDQNPTEGGCPYTDEEAKAVKSRLHNAFTEWAQSLQGKVFDTRIEHSADKNARKLPAKRQLKIQHSLDFDPTGKYEGLKFEL